MMKRFVSMLMIAALLITTLCIPAFAEEKKDYSVEGTYTVESVTPKGATHSNIYNKPSSSKGKNLRKVEDGEQVYVYYRTGSLSGSSSKWAYCEYKDTKGYIRFENLTKGTQPKKKTNEKKKKSSEKKTNKKEKSSSKKSEAKKRDDDSGYTTRDRQRALDRIGDYLGDMYVANCNSWVSLREMPDTGSLRLAKVPWGARVEAYAYSKKWLGVYYRGMMGFIAAKYLEY